MNDLDIIHPCYIDLICSKTRNFGQIHIYSTCSQQMYLLYIMICLTLSKRSPGFYVSEVQIFWKKLWEKEKLLVTSNFSFSTVFTTHLESFLPFSSNSKMSSANSFSLEESKICCLGKGELLWQDRRYCGKKGKFYQYTPFPQVSKTSLPGIINPFPHNDTFWRPWETSLLKTLWEKEKLLVTSNFSFSHSVFYPFG